LGVARTWAEIDTADAVVFLHDLSKLLPADKQSAHAQAEIRTYLDADAVLAKALQSRLKSKVPVIDVWNKSDAVAPDNQHLLPDAVLLSARTGEGLDQLRTALLQAAGWQPASEGSYMARERHLQALGRVSNHLDLAQSRLEIHPPALDLLAEELRLAQNALGEITGAFGADDLLGVIFSKFCIGK
jgi:tRNA modification GTPase